MDGTTETAPGGAAGTGCPDSLEGVLVAGTYRVAQWLGGGGMGEVYQAEHVRLGSPVAIKFLREGARTDQRSTDRFHHEARRAAAIRSQHVVRVFDYGRLEDGTPYLVMERLFGEDLRCLLQREHPLPIRRAVQLVVGACRGLAAVHAAGLVHRDLKPANLFVERAVDGTEICKVLDFGVAKALESDTTRPGSLVGTIRYMPPEQLEDAGSTTLLADVYALGAILYECVTGTPAHQGGTLEETMFNIVHRGVPKPSAERALPSELEAAIMRAVARAPSKRFASMHDFARALAPFGPVARTPEGAASPEADTLDEARESTRKSPRPASPALAVALVAGTIGALGGWAARGGEPSRDRVEEGVRTESARRQTDAPHPATLAHLPAPPSPRASPPPALSATAPAVSPPISSAHSKVTARAPLHLSPPPPPPPPQVAARAPIAGRFDPSDPYR